MNPPSPLYSMRPNTFSTAQTRQPHRKQDTGKTSIPLFTACDPFFTNPASPSPIILQYRKRRSGKRKPPKVHAAWTRNVCRSRFLLLALAHGGCPLRLSFLTIQPEASRSLMKSHTARPSNGSLPGRLGRRRKRGE